MQHSFNSKSLIGVALCLFLGMGAMALHARAEGRRNPPPPIPWEKCGDIDDVAAFMHGELSDRTDNLLAARREELNHLNEARIMADSGRAQDRLRADEIRALQFATLLARATSTKARAAITAFQTAVAEAVRVRRLAADRAIADFRSDLDAEIAARRARVDAARTSLIENLNAGLARSKSSCGKEGRPVRSRDELRMSVQSVQARFLDEVRGADASETTLRAMINEKQTALLAAERTMRASLDAARVQLVKALR